MQVAPVKPSHRASLLGAGVTAPACVRFSLRQELHGRGANGAFETYVQQPYSVFKDRREILFDAKWLFPLPSIPDISLSLRAGSHAESTFYWLSVSWG